MIVASVKTNNYSNCPLHTRGARTPRGGGGTLIFSYIRRLGSFMGVQKFEFQYVFCFFRKMIFFLGGEGGGMMILWIFWGGHH